MRILLDLQGCQAIGSRHRGIGRYSLALAKAMMRAGEQHEFHVLLNAAFPDTIEPLRRELAEWLAPERFALFHVPSGCAEINGSDRWRTHAAERVRSHAIRALKPDVLHVSSLFEGLVDDCATAIDPARDGTPTAVTLYDLIPLLNPQRYLADERTHAWYARKIESLRRADLLLGISGSACEEARSALQAQRVVNISSAADPAMFHPGTPGDAAQRVGLKRPFVMYTGGIDWRKNIEGLVRAYALLPSDVRAAHQLALVCQAEAYARTEIHALARKLGLDLDEVVLTGYVSDADLADLYRSCALFVFPSLHEGFGLPALEAMMCGAPVIGSNATSVPEVIGREDALFDPRSDHAIAQALLKGLRDEAFRSALRDHAPTQAARFSWQLTGARALAALEDLHRDRVNRPPPAVVTALRARPRLAMLAPLPPARSGIADYTAELLPVLREHYEIDLVCDQPEVSLPEGLRDLPVRSVAWFGKHAGEFDRVVYQFGNSIFHAHMFPLLREYPGVVVLHDFFLSGVLNWLDAVGAEPGMFQQALFASHGPAAVEDDKAIGRDAAVEKYPVNREVLQRASGVIVHSRYAIDAARRWYGQAYSAQWHHIPHLRILPVAIDRARARAALGLGPDDFLVCSFGHIAPTKLNMRAIAAWRASTLSRDPRCRLVLVGGGRPPYGDEVQRSIRAGDRITITGYADRELYERYLCAADLAIQLRTMSRGETSGAVLDCLAHGVPLIANANGSNAEYPPEIVALLPDEFDDAQVVRELERLRADEGERQRRSRAGRDWVRDRHDPVTVARQYRDAIEDFAAHPLHANYWDTVRALAALAPSPRAEDLIEAAVALDATESSLSGTGRDTPAPCGGR